MTEEQTDWRNGLREMSLALAHTKDADLIERFFESLLTKSEIEELAKRWELVKLIAEGHSQRAIAKELGLSLCKITRGSKELKKEDSAFAEMLRICKRVELQSRKKNPPKDL